MPRVVTRPRTSRAARALAAAGSLVALAACADLLAIDGNVTISGAEAGAPPLFDASAVACGLPTGSPTCQACVEAHCCAQATTCASSAACAGYESCVVPCGSDYACRAQCTIERASNDPGIAPVDQCVAASCGAECGVQCGLTASTTEPDAAAGCQECLVAHACAPAQTCGTNLACVELAGCVGACDTPDCQSACSDDDDAGALLTAVSSAAASSCLAACQFGQHWECVGNVTSPIAKGPHVNLTITVTNLTSGQVLSGVDVAACNALDSECTSTYASGKTDAAGVVALSLPTDGVGFGGYLEVTATPLEMMPVLYFFAYQLTETSFPLSVSMLDQATLQGIVGSTVTLDSTRGSVFVSTLDCALQFAPGVVLTTRGTDAESQLFYASGTVLNPDAKATDPSGFAVLLNAPVTAISFVATPVAVNRESSHTSVFVRAGTISYVEMLPN